MIKKLITLLSLFFYINVAYAEENNILDKVESSARSWLGLVDSGKYKESWENLSSLLKAKTSEAEWIKSMIAIRVPRGTVNARYIATAGATKALSGFPEGDYVVLQFYTTFTEKGLALETVILAKTSNEAWQVTEYAIK